MPALLHFNTRCSTGRDWRKALSDKPNGSSLSSRMPPSKAKRGTPNGTGGAASSSKAFTGAGHQQQRGAAVVCSTASQPNAEQEATKWDKFTDRLVSLSSIPFSILVLPQVVQNLTNMTAGNAGALSIISWEGYMSAAFGNTLMCSHFAGKGERSAVNVQLIGILNNFFILSQVALAGFMPAITYAAALVFTACAVGITLWHFAASSQQAQPTDRLSIWNMWQLGSGLIGLAVVPQVLYNTLAPMQPSTLPFFVSLGVLALFFLSKVLGKVSSATVDTIEHLPGWAATLLFALSPLPQLVRNFIDVRSLEGLSVGTMLLALLGNALMVPRALYTRDTVWLTGTLWACTAGWGQLLSMYLRTSSVTGSRFLEPSVFFVVTTVLFSYLLYVWRRNSGSQKPKMA